MIHQPGHLLGVAAYGIMSLITLGLGLARLKTTEAAQRTARWRLLFMAAGLGMWAADEWHWVTLWPLVRTVRHGFMYNIGSAFIAVAIFSVIWTSLKPTTGTDEAGH